MAEEELADLTSLRRGRVRLAAYPSAAATLVPRAVAGLRARHPDVDVELTEAEPPEALALVAAGDVGPGAGLLVRRRPDHGPGLVWRPLGRRAGRAGPGRRPPWPRPERLTLADLADEPWIVGCERCRAHALPSAPGRLRARGPPRQRRLRRGPEPRRGRARRHPAAALRARGLPPPARRRARARVVRHPHLRPRAPRGAERVPATARCADPRARRRALGSTPC